MIICITGLPGSGTLESATRFVREFERQGFRTVRYSTDWMRYILWPALRHDYVHCIADMLHNCNFW